MDETPLKEVVWVGPTRKELRAFPRPVQRVVGYALHAVQLGETPPEALIPTGMVSTPLGSLKLVFNCFVQALNADIASTAKIFFTCVWFIQWFLKIIRWLQSVIR